MNNIAILWQNPHLRYAVAIILGIKVASLWLPKYKDQLTATSELVTFYALAAAANSGGPADTTTKPKE